MIISTTIKNSQPSFTVEQRKLMKDFFVSIEGKNIYIAFSERKFPRTLGQNALLWGVIYIAISNHTGDTVEEIHSFCKNEFLPRIWTIEEGREVELPKSTTRLTTSEFSNFIERVVAWGSSFHGIDFSQLDKDAS